MSHSTGIEASEQLLNVFSSLNEEEVRLIKIGIEHEQIEFLTLVKVGDGWAEDYKQHVVAHIEEKQPCYFLFRMDSKNNLGYEWLFITWSPDIAAVRDKMVFAATRSAVKVAFGGGKIVDELNATAKDDITYKGYMRHKEAKEAPPPLTLAEEELELVKRTEIDTASNVNSKTQTVPGLSFPVTQAVHDKLIELNSETLNYIRLVIHIEEELIDVEDVDSIDVRKLPSKVPSNHARYHVYSYHHSHEGDFLHSLIFIYTMPGYGCPVKERMLYSTCKAPLTQFIESTLQKEIDKKIEVEKGEELTDAFLYEEVHPTKNIAKQAFSKPKGPANRGPRRVTRPPTDAL